MATSELASDVAFMAWRDDVGRSIGKEESVNWLGWCEVSLGDIWMEKDRVALKERQGGSREVALGVIGVLVDGQP